MTGTEPNSKIGSPPPFGRDLAPRIWSSLILVPVTLALLYLGGVWFALLVGAVFVGVHREWQTMAGGRPPRLADNMLTGMLGLSALAYPMAGIPAAITLIGVGAVFAVVTGGRKRLWDLAGIVFFGLVVLAILAIRDDTIFGLYAGLFLGAAIWLTDTGAYFTGRLVGGAKLSPDISPTKTWSGAFGGLATGTLLALLVWVLATSSPWWLGLVFGAGLSIFGQLGDLAESAIKRRFRIKDSGDIIPGHGGLMDRLDSLSFAALALFIIGGLHAGFDNVAEGFLFWP